MAKKKTSNKSLKPGGRVKSSSVLSKTPKKSKKTVTTKSKSRSENSSAKKSKAKSVKSSASKSMSSRSSKVSNKILPLGIQIDDQIWPMERDVLFRPDRLKYVRKLVKPSGCVFCTANESEPSLETLCVFKSQHSMVVINKYPYNSGHVLVIPQRHCGDLLALSDDEYNDLQGLIRIVMSALNDLYQPSGINVGLNHGAAAGAGIPQHLHWHVIPRWEGDLNFFPLIAETKVLVESLEATYDKLWSRLNEYE